MKELVYADAQSFFGGPALKSEDVAIPGVGIYRVRELTVSEWRQYQSASVKTKADGRAVFEADQAMLVKLGTVHPSSGQPVFTDADLPKLRGSIGVSRLIPLAKAIYGLCGDSDAEAAEGNAEATNANAS
jgi:hypothetical protein